VDGSRPSMPCMEQLFTCASTELMNGFLGYSILEVGIDATEGEALVSACACIFEIVVSKSTIVTTVMQDSHTMLFGKVLESSFGINCLLRGETSHQVNLLQTCVMIGKDHDSSV